jgi:hypothetical protein
VLQGFAEVTCERPGMELPDVIQAFEPPLSQSEVFVLNVDCQLVRFVDEQP